MTQYLLINAADLDEAPDWAKLATVACRLPIEVSPFDERDPDSLLAELQDEHGAWRGAP